MIQKKVLVVGDPGKIPPLISFQVSVMLKSHFDPYCPILVVAASVQTWWTKSQNLRSAGFPPVNNMEGSGWSDTSVQLMLLGRKEVPK